MSACTPTVNIYFYLFSPRKRMTNKFVYWWSILGSYKLIKLYNTLTSPYVYWGQSLYIFPKIDTFHGAQVCLLFELLHNYFVGQKYLTRSILPEGMHALQSSPCKHLLSGRVDTWTLWNLFSVKRRRSLPNAHMANSMYWEFQGLVCSRRERSARSRTCLSTVFEAEMCIVPGQRCYF